MIYMLLFAAAFGGVSLKAWQQLNVQHDRSRWVPPTSYGMALFDFMLISNVAYGALLSEGTSMWLMVIATGTGGWMGCLCSMKLHKRVRAGQ